MFRFTQHDKNLFKEVFIMKEEIYSLKPLLDSHYEARNKENELSLDKPDPLLVVKKHLDNPHIAEIALICALLSYGNAKRIVKTLDSLDFSNLDSVQKASNASYPLYRFQTSDDIKELFIIMAKIIESGGIKKVFMQGFKQFAHISKWSKSSNAKHLSILGGIYCCIDRFYSLASFSSFGLEFALGKNQWEYLKANNDIKASTSPLKRWNMYLRWLVRADNLDLGLWNDIESSNLLLPLDTHTFKLCKTLKLLDRKSYDLASVLQVSQKLAILNKEDPIKYDFSLYRIGQEKININTYK